MVDQNTSVNSMEVLLKSAELLYNMHDQVSKKELWSTLAVYITKKGDGSRYMSVRQLCMLIELLREKCLPHHLNDPFLRVSPEGMLSLHIAATIGCPMRVLQLIVKMAPETLWALDNKKMRPSRCKDCGGSGLCQHQRQRSQCKDCGGGGLCEHQRRSRKGKGKERVDGG